MQMPNAVTWEGWVTPPDYTGLPQLYLNDLTDRDELNCWQDQVFDPFLWCCGRSHPNRNRVSPYSGCSPATDQKQEFTIAQAGEIAITGQNAQVWTVTLRDDRPTVTLDQAFETDFFGVSKLGYRVTDDYGVTEINANIVLDIDQLDRRYGLRVPQMRTNRWSSKSHFPSRGAARILPKFGNPIFQKMSGCTCPWS